jgi:hypothetical protein
MPAIGVAVGTPFVAVLRNALLAVVHAAAFLLESGGNLLTEDGSYLLLE